MYYWIFCFILQIPELYQGYKTTVPYFLFFSFYSYQRHLLRDRRCDTTACSACWATVSGEEKIFCTGPTRAAKAGQQSLVPARGTQQPTKKGPFHLYSLSPHLPQFQDSAEATPLWSFCYLPPSLISFSSPPVTQTHTPRLVSSSCIPHTRTAQSP